MIECSICTETIINPKFLPCLHTFCCQCIENLVTHANNGGELLIRSVPCPLCRSPFNTPTGVDIGRFPTNVYAEELVRVIGILQAANGEHQHIKDKLDVAKTKLKASEDGRQKAVEEKYWLNTMLAEKETKLKDNSLQLQEMKRKLSAAESTESGLRERQRLTLKQLKDTESRCEASKIKAEICWKAKMEAETALAAAEQSCRKLQQTQKKDSEQLVDAKRRLQMAMTEVETYEEAKNDAEESLVKADKVCQSLRQQLQQTQRENSDQLKDAEHRYEVAIADAARCNKAKNDVEASLLTSKKDLEQSNQVNMRLNNQLAKKEEEINIMGKVNLLMLKYKIKDFCT